MVSIPSQDTIKEILSILIIIISVLTGYFIYLFISEISFDWLGKALLAALVALFLITLQMRISSGKMKNKADWVLFICGVFSTVVITIITLQSAAAVLFPKFSISFGDEFFGRIYYKTYNDSVPTYSMSQIAYIEAQMPLFPVRVDNSCRTIYLGWNITDFGMEKDVLPITTKVVSNNSVELCIRYADAWSIDKITIPVHYTSWQNINAYISASVSSSNSRTLDYIWPGPIPNTTDIQNVDEVWFSNRESFPVVIESDFYILNDSRAWKTVFGRQPKSFRFFYTENLEKFNSRENILDLANTSDKIILTMTVRLEPKEEKAFYILFDNQTP